MKKTIFLAAILIAALGFTGCGGSDKNGGDLTITVKVSHGDLVNSQVDEVRAMGYIDLGGGSWDGIIIATAPFKNGGFKITLPQKFDERLLETIDFEAAFPEITNLTVSNKNVKTTFVNDYYLEAFKNNLWAGNFHSDYSTPDTEAYLLYQFVDGNCKVSGSYTKTEVMSGITYKYEQTADLNLKKGWNTVYIIHVRVGTTQVYKVTTKKPDFDIIWHFRDSSSFAPPKDAKPFKYFKR